MEKYFYIGAVVVALAGAFSDVRSARIPNELTYTAITAAIVLRTVLLGLFGLKTCGLGILIAGGFFALLFVLGAMGGGDLKMMTAIGAWVGGSHILTVLIAIGLAGGVLAITSAIFNRNTIQTVRNTARLIAYRFTSGLQPHPEMNVQAHGSRRIPQHQNRTQAVLLMTTTFSSCSLSYSSPIGHYQRCWRKPNNWPATSPSRWPIPRRSRRDRPPSSSVRSMRCFLRTRWTL